MKIFSYIKLFLPAQRSYRMASLSTDAPAVSLGGAASHWPIYNAHNVSTYKYKINTKSSIESMCQNISNCTTYP